MLGTETTWPAGNLSVPIVRRALVGSIMAALVVGVFLLARRATGALAVPLPPLMLIATALVLLAWSLVVHVFADGRVNATWSWLPTVVLALVAVACSYPGGRLIDWLVWLPVIVANSFAPRLLTHRSITKERIAPAPVRDLSADRVLQQITRSRTVEGQDVIQGTLTAEFAPNERNVSLHVGFCPPFEQLPQIEAEPVDGPNCDIKIAQILHQGARIEIRLDAVADTTQRVAIEFVATAELPPALPKPPLAI